MSAIWIPQGVAHTFRAGPFLSTDDAKTRVTNAVINQASKQLSKAGGAFAQSANAAALAHEARGYYPMTLAAADVDTLGALRVDIDVAGCLAVKHEFFVVHPDALSALQGAGVGLRANAVSVNGLTSAAIRLALAAGEMYPFTVDIAGFAPSTSEFESSDLTTAGVDHFKGRTIIWTSGALKGQATDITAYSVVGGRGHFTVTQLNAPPAGGMSGLVV